MFYFKTIDIPVNKGANSRLGKIERFVSTRALLIYVCSLVRNAGKVYASRRAFWVRMRVSAERQWRGRIKSDGGEIENSHKVTGLLKAISLVIWIPFFPTKNVLHDKNRKFSMRVFSCRFFSNRFSWPFKDLKRLNA